MAKKVNDKIVNEATTETPQTETLNKVERRNRNLKIKHEAKCKAFNEKLNWYDEIPAAAFHQNFDKAFADATNHPKATELLRDPALPVETTAAQVETVATVEKPVIVKPDATSMLEAVKNFKEQVAEGAEEIKPLVAGVIITPAVANDNTETKADEPATTSETQTDATEQVASSEERVEAPSAEGTADADGAAVATNEGSETASDESVGEQTTTQLVDEFDDTGKLIKREGESSRAYNRRKHVAKQTSAWKKPDATEGRIGERIVAAETEGRNGDPPAALPGLPTGKTPSEINKTLPTELPEAKVDPMLKQPGESKKAWKARIALLNQVAAEVAAGPVDDFVPEKDAKDSANVFEAAAMGDETKVSPTEVALKNFAGEIKQIAENYTAAEVPDATNTGTEEATTTENPVADTPAEEASQEQKPEVQEPVQTESVSTEAVPGPSEAKTDKKPTLTLVAKDNLTPEETEAAKKFYGTGWKDESAALLCKALFWLNKAVEYDSNIRSGKAPANPKINPRVSYRLAMNAALKHEAEAFGNKPVELSLTEVVKMFADFPDNHQKAA